MNCNTTHYRANSSSVPGDPTPLIVLKWVLLAALVAAVGWLFYDMWDASVVPPALTSWLTFRNVALFLLTTLAFAVVAAAVNALVGKRRGRDFMRLIKWRGTIRDIAVGLGMSTLGFIAARIHLHLFDKLFLRYGRLDNFPRK